MTAILKAWQHLRRALERPEGGRGAAWLGKLFVGRRAILLAPFFIAAALAALREGVRPSPASTIPAALVLVAAYLGRIWATGYRTWYRKSGEDRYLMTAGPYARVRHPLYLVNGVAGAAALVAFERWCFLAAYVPLYALMIAFVIVREEEVLASRYGAEHAAYRARVPAFVPLPFRCQPTAERRGEFRWKPVRAGWEPAKLAGLIAALAGLVAWSIG